MVTIGFYIFFKLEVSYITIKFCLNYNEDLIVATYGIVLLYALLFNVFYYFKLRGS